MADNITSLPTLTEQSRLSSETTVMSRDAEKKGKYPVASIDKINEYFRSHKELIRKYMCKVISGNPKIGMNSDMLALTYGEPVKKINKKANESIVEVWVVQNENKESKEASYTIIGLKDDIVVAFDSHSKDQDPGKIFTEMSK